MFVNLGGKKLVEIRKSKTPEINLFTKDLPILLQVYGIMLPLFQPDTTDASAAQIS